jgi:hypothetical protein
MRHDIVNRVFFLLCLLIVGACLLFGWAVKG